MLSSVYSQLCTRQSDTCCISYCFITAAVSCPALPDVTNGQLVYSIDSPPPYNFGTRVEYSCDTGYGISGGEGVLFCGGDGSSILGSWSGLSPTCEGMSVCGY